MILDTDLHYARTVFIFTFFYFVYHLPISCILNILLYFLRNFTTISFNLQFRSENEIIIILLRLYALVKEYFIVSIIRLLSCDTHMCVDLLKVYALTFHFHIIVV